MLKELIVMTVLSSLAFTFSANAGSVSCSITPHGKPYSKIELGELLGEVNLADYNERGTLAVTATVSGNDKSVNFTGTVQYKKVGSRIEIGMPVVIIELPYEKIENQFGAFPEIKCTIS